MLNAVLHITLLILLIADCYVINSFIIFREKLILLCRAISNQVILQCSRSVNLSHVFEGNTHSGIKVFEDIITCCLKYRLIYDKVYYAEDSYIHII